MSNLASKCTKSNKFFGRESLVRQFSREIIISSSFPFSISKGLSNGKMFNCTMASDFKCLLIFSKLDLSILNYFFVLWFFQSIQWMWSSVNLLGTYVCQKGQSSQLLVVLLLPWYSATSFPKRSLKPIIRPEKRSFTLKRHNYF